jgi:acetyl esterase
MNRLSSPAPITDELSPDMRRFQQWLSAAYADHPPLDTVSLPQAREIIEKVRAPLSQGGPVMARSLRLQIDRGDQPALQLCIHQPAQTLPLPALLYLHGGGWVYFSNSTHDRLMREYAARSGRVVVGLDYAQAPESRYPVALQQCMDAIHWIRHSGAEHGICTTQIAIAGDSAGANLALATALALRDHAESSRLDDFAALDALVLNYGAFTDDDETESYQRFDGDRFVLTRDEMRWFWQQYLRNDADRLDPLAQPGRAALHGLPPTCLIAAECDVLRDNSLHLAERLQAAGVRHSLHRFAGAPHSFLEAMPFSEQPLKAIDMGARWLTHAAAAADASEQSPSA